MNIGNGKMKRFDRQEYNVLMQPLFEKAIREGLWFYAVYQALWFSPEELETANNNGKYLWGPFNWQLRNPQQKMEELENQKENIDRQIHDLTERINNSKHGRTTHP